VLRKLHGVIVHMVIVELGTNTSSSSSQGYNHGGHPGKTVALTKSMIAQNLLGERADVVKDMCGSMSCERI
jgi:hypothetical protein